MAVTAHIVIRATVRAEREGSCNGCHGAAVRVLEFGSRLPPVRGGMFHTQATQLRFCADCFAEVRRQMRLHRPAL